MNWLYFFTSSLIRCGSRFSCASSLRCRLTVVPRPSVLPRGSFTIENEAASDSQMCCSSSLCFDVTTTRSATVHNTVPCCILRQDINNNFMPKHHEGTGCSLQQLPKRLKHYDYTIAQNTRQLNTRQCKVTDCTNCVYFVTYYLSYMVNYPLKN